MSSVTKVILLACGSFNPITNMHLRLFELARDWLRSTGKFEVVEGIISPVNDAYGKVGLLPAIHRIEMIKLALGSSDWIKLDTWESEQSEWTPTAQVMARFQNEAAKKFNTDGDIEPAHKRTKLETSSSNTNDSNTPVVKLLCGADLLESFGVPGLWEKEDILRIVSKQGIVCISRSDTDPRKFIYEDDLLHTNKENILLVTEWITNDISSTKIRRAVSRGESVRYLVQDPVVEYINKHKLYSSSPTALPLTK